VVQDAKHVKIDAVVARLDVQDIKNAPGTCVELELQLEWHWHQDSQVLKKMMIKLKEAKIKALVEAVEHHNSGQWVVILPVNENSIQVDIPSDLDEEDSDWE